MKIPKDLGDVHGDIVKNILGGGHPRRSLCYPILVAFFGLNTPLARKYHFGDDGRGYHNP